MSIFNPFTWMAASRLSVDEEIAQKPLPLAGPPTVSKPRLLTTAEIMKHYGRPGDPDSLTTFEPPYPFYFDWDLNTPVKKITVHKKIAAPLLAVCKDVLAHYGLAKIKELHIDQFGGCFNHRPMRGLEKKYEAAIKAKNFTLAFTYLSRHSWAIAGDWDTDRNQLKWKADRAQFAKAEYKAMIDIFYKHGFISYGRERSNDFMHFEIGIIL